jgi:hypothetical protein
MESDHQRSYGPRNVVESLTEWNLLSRLFPNGSTNFAGTLGSNERIGVGIAATTVVRCHGRKEANKVVLSTQTVPRDVQ